MFDKILIANRGEIACRIMRTCRRMGVRTVAVYSDADASALHVRAADEAVRLGPAPAADSYLKGEAIIAAALQFGAQAIHPGYGFLSERAEFALACHAAGIVFIGPPVEAIRTMGLKGAAKILMREAEVPVLPGYEGTEQSDDFLMQQAVATGWPLLIKAEAGGGGKGMRKVVSPDEFLPALAGARREALAAFGDHRVVLEKYLAQARHIEVQVFGDQSGNVVHLFERDCSVQRRHQKIIEEAPAFGLPDEMRAAMGAAAVAAAKAVNYTGAGTVEFIADVSAGLRPDRFYFMEMNTRLQVEHPVTEAITGVDLVEWQLRIAAGERLPLGQEQISFDGHAIEARIYAENPAQGFLPSTGQLLHLRAPGSSRFVRVDTGVRQGDTVTLHYDPMIAKLVARGASREDALRRLRLALEAYEIAGPHTNRDFLLRVAEHQAFAAGDVDTGFVDKHATDLLAATEDVADVLVLATLHLMLMRRTLAGPQSAWDESCCWHNNLDVRETFRFTRGDVGHEVVAVHARGRLSLICGERTFDIASYREDAGHIEVECGGRRLRSAVAQGDAELTIITRRQTVRLMLDANVRADDAEEGSSAGVVDAPMPGRVIEVFVRDGDSVERNAPVLVLEAMKMEYTIRAPVAGAVRSLLLRAGDQVSEGARLFAIEP